MTARPHPPQRLRRLACSLGGALAAGTLLLATAGVADAEPATLALERTPHGHLVVAGALNGAPARWVVDTAATGTTLTAAAVAALGLPPVPGAERTVHASGGSLRTSVYAIDAAGAGGRVLRNLRTVALPDGVSVGMDVAGLLGSDWLRLSMPEFDFERGTLTLHDRASAADVRERLREEGYVAVPFRPDRHGLLVFQLQLGGGAAFAVLDTGADRSVFNWPAAALAGIAAGDPRLAPADRIGGATGHHVDSSSAPLGTVRAVAAPAGAPPVEWHDVTALVADMPVYERLRGANLPTVTVGMDLLGQKRGLVVDFTGHRLWIR
jgi:predicted aspartyl protease